MLSKRIIATLIAGSFAAAQAGAHSYLSDAAGSISDQGYSAQVQVSETSLSEDSFPRYLTVFNPDGTSYSLVADAYTAELAPELLVMMTESMPEHLTVFDPDGTVTAYDFTPVDVAYVEPLFDLAVIESDESDSTDMLAMNGDTPVILVEVADPIIVAVAEDDMGYNSVIAYDAAGVPWLISSQIAFDEALERTG